LYEQLPELSFSDHEKVLISVVDNRWRIKAGKPKEFIGTAHANFGLTQLDWDVARVLATEDEDRMRSLSQWLEHRIVNSFRIAGWYYSEVVYLDKVPSEVDAKNILEDNQASALMLFDLNEWFIDMSIGLAPVLNFNTNTNTYIYKPGVGKVLEKNFKSRNAAKLSGNQSPQDAIIKAYKVQLQKILTDRAVKESLVR
jgi:hypothetical protein